MCSPLSLPARAEAPREVPALEVGSRDARLAVEALDDGLIHFEFAAADASRRSDAWIPTTPMVLHRERMASRRVVRGNALDTAVVHLRIDPVTLCLEVTDRRREPPSPVT